MNNETYVDNPLNTTPQYQLSLTGTPNATSESEDALHSFEIIVPITVIYIVIFFSGLVGNISTCIVIARNKTMHTATNYYLFNLAVSDLLLLVSGIPPETYSLWYTERYVFGEAFCVLQGFAAETSVNVTVLTITAFTVERYLAICYPFIAYTMSKLSRVIKFVILIWVVSLCLAAPQAFQFGIKYTEGSNGSMKSSCTVTGGEYAQHAFEISSFLFFVGPMTIITVLYILIAIKLHKSKFLARNSGLHRSCGRTDTINSRTRGTVGERRVIKMLVAVVAAFFICWAPFHAQRLLAMYMQTASMETQTAFVNYYIVLNYVSGVLYYASTTVNPILYHIMSRKFREAFKVTLAQLCKKRPKARRKDFYLSLAKCHRSFRSDRPTDCTEVQDFRSSRNSNDIKNVTRNGIGMPTIKRQYAKETSISTAHPPLPYTEEFNGISKPRVIPRSIHDVEKFKRYPYRKNYNGDCSADRLKYRLFHIFHNKRSQFNRQRSFDSNTSATNTISNSSLQDVDDSEFTSSDLVRYMEQINSDIA